MGCATTLQEPCPPCGCEPPPPPTQFQSADLNRLAGEFRLSYALAGALTSAYFLSYAALQLPAGMLVDHLGARRVLLAALAIVAVGVLLFPFVPNFEVALGLRLLIGLGAAPV